MAKTINLTQNTQEWHEYRKTRIGASDSCVIMGKGFKKTPYRLWCEKLGLCGQDPMNEAMKRGQELEPIARNNCAQLLGIALKPMVLEHPAIPYMFASLDAISEDGSVIVEIKCPMRGIHETVPEYYMPQLTHQMIVANVGKCLYFSFDGEVGKLIEVKLNKDYAEEIYRHEAKFHLNMIDFEPPELTDKDYVSMHGNQEWMHCANRLITVKKKMKMYEDMEKKLRENLIELAGNTNAQGSGLKLTKSLRKGCVEYSKIPEMQGVNLDEYRKKSSEFWRFTIDGQS